MDHDQERKSSRHKKKKHRKEKEERPRDKKKAKRKQVVQLENGAPAEEEEEEEEPIPVSMLDNLPTQGFGENPPRASGSSTLGEPVLDEGPMTQQHLVALAFWERVTPKHGSVPHN